MCIKIFVTCARYNDAVLPPGSPEGDFVYHIDQAKDDGELVARRATFVLGALCLGKDENDEWKFKKYGKRNSDLKGAENQKLFAAIFRGCFNAKEFEVRKHPDFPDENFEPHQNSKGWEITTTFESEGGTAEYTRRIFTDGDFQTTLIIHASVPVKGLLLRSQMFRKHQSEMFGDDQSEVEDTMKAVLEFRDGHAVLDIKGKDDKLKELMQKIHHVKERLARLRGPAEGAPVPASYYTRFIGDSGFLNTSESILCGFTCGGDIAAGIQGHSNGIVAGPEWTWKWFADSLTMSHHSWMSQRNFRDTLYFLL